MISSIIEEFLIEKNLFFEDLKIKNFISYRLKNYDALVAIISFLKQHKQVRMSILIDLFGVDFPNLEKRFEVVYSFLSLELNKRFLFKINLSEDEELSSISDIFVNADWYERELFDMFGIKFSKPLERILTDYGFIGYPLRKDFPLTGHLEIKYDHQLKKIIHEPVVLDQEFQNFDFESSWKGPEYKIAPKHGIENNKSDEKN